MAHTHYEFTNMVMCDIAEEIYAGSIKLSIQMIICYFKNDGDQINLSDDISYTASDTTDDTIIHLWGQGDDDQIIVNWSAKPRHVYGLNVVTISGGSLAYVYLA